MKNKDNVSKVNKFWTKKRVGIVSVCGIAILSLGCYVGYGVNQSGELVKALKNSTSDLQELTVASDTKLLDSKTGYLLTTVKTKDVSDTILKLEEQNKTSENLYKTISYNNIVNKEQVSKYKKLLEKQIKDTEEEIDKLTTLSEINQELTKLYQTEQTTVTSDVSKTAIKTDLTSDKVKVINAKISELSKSIETKDLTTKVKVIIDNANTQIKTISDSKNLVSKVFKDNKVISLDETATTNALKTVNTITDTKVKEQLTTEIKKVQEAIKKDKEEKARIAKEKAEAEAKAQAEAQAQAQAESQAQAQAQAQNTTSSSNNTTTVSNNSGTTTTKSNSGTTSSSSNTTTQATTTQVSGDFIFNGHGFPVRWFSGSGRVPADGNVYRWTELSKHYLIDRAGVAGSYVTGIGIGTKVTVYGTTYTVYDIRYHMNRNDSATSELVFNSNSAISFQTCEDSTGNILTLYFAR